MPFLQVVFQNLNNDRDQLVYLKDELGKLPGSPGRKHSKRIMELTKRDTEIERVYIAEGYVGV